MRFAVERIEVESESGHSSEGGLNILATRRGLEIIEEERLS